MNYTSIEQSKKLLELGLNPESADMHWWIDDGNKAVFIGYNVESAKNYTDTKMDYIPCWSVGALLELMPPTIKPENREESCNMEFFKGLSGKFHFRYIGAGRPTDILNLIIGTPIECAYQMVVWLLENNYIK